MRSTFGDESEIRTPNKLVDWWAIIAPCIPANLAPPQNSTGDQHALQLECDGVPVAVRFSLRMQSKSHIAVNGIFRF
jgi:hypothetical protein